MSSNPINVKINNTYIALNIFPFMPKIRDYPIQSKS